MAFTMYSRRALSGSVDLGVVRSAQILLVPGRDVVAESVVTTV
jgi:hypothetical protein